MNNALVQCQTCGKEEEVNFGYCLFNGWPKCCGYTMRLVKHNADIEKAVSDGIPKFATITVQHSRRTEQ